MTDLDRRYSPSFDGELVKLTPEIVDFKVGLFRSRSGFGRGLQAIGTYALPGDTSAIRKPGRSTLYGALTPGGGGGGGRLGRRIGGERQYERCPGGFEFGGRFGKNCGRRLFKLPGEGVSSGLERQGRNMQRLADAANPDAPRGRVNPIKNRPVKDGPVQIQRDVDIPQVGPKNPAKREAAVSAAANAVVSNEDNPSLLVRRDGVTLAPSVPITDLGRLRRNADMENGIFVAAQKEAKTIGDKEIPALLSSGLDGVVFGFPGGGRLNVTKQKELSPSDVRRLNGAFKRGAAAAEELDYDAGIRAMVDASGGAIKYDARFPGIKRPYERVTVENAKGGRRSVARWVYATFLSATAPQRFGRTLWEIVESPVVTAIRAQQQKSDEEQQRCQTKQNLVEYRTSSFQSESDFASFVFQVKRVAAVWDPDLPPSGGFRCPEGTRYGGRITDRFGRNCGWAVGRRLANRLEQIGRGLGNRLDDRRDRRAERGAERERLGAERRVRRAERALTRAEVRARSIEGGRVLPVLGRRGQEAQRRRVGRAAERIDRRAERVRRARDVMRGRDTGEEIDERGAGRLRRRAERAQRLRDFADRRDGGEGRESRRRGRARVEEDQEAQRKLTQQERDDLVDMVDYLDEDDPRREQAISRLAEDGFNISESRRNRTPSPYDQDLTDEELLDAIRNQDDNKTNPRRGELINEARNRGLVGTGGPNDPLPQDWQPNEDLLGRSATRRRRRGAAARRLRNFAEGRDAGEGEERDRQARERADARSQRRLDRRARRAEARQRRIDRRAERGAQRRDRRGERDRQREERAQRLRDFADGRDFGEGRERDQRVRQRRADRAQRRAERLERRRERRRERRQRRRERMQRLRRFADRRDYGEGRERDRRIRDRGRAETIRPEDETDIDVDEGAVPEGRQPRPGGRQPRPGGRQPRPGGRRPDGRQPRPGRDEDRFPIPEDEDGTIIDPGPIPTDFPPPGGRQPRPGGRGPRPGGRRPRPQGGGQRPPRPVFNDDDPVREYSDDELARMIAFLEETLFRPTLQLLLPDIEERLNVLRAERDRRREERNREPDSADVDPSVGERPDVDEARRIRYQDTSDADLRRRRDLLERLIGRESDDEQRNWMLQEKDDIEQELFRREMDALERSQSYDPQRRQRPLNDMSDQEIADELSDIANYVANADNSPDGVDAAERRRTELADELMRRGSDAARVRDNMRLSRYSDRDIRTEINRIENMLDGPRPITRRRREAAERRLAELRAEMDRRNATGTGTGNSTPIPGDSIIPPARNSWDDPQIEYWNRRAGATVGMPEDGDIGQMYDEHIDRVIASIDEIIARADDPDEVIEIRVEERSALDRLKYALNSEKARRQRGRVSTSQRQPARIAALLGERDDRIPDVNEMTADELWEEHALIETNLLLVDNSRDRAILVNRMQEIVDEQTRRRRQRDSQQRTAVPGFVSEDQELPVAPVDGTPESFRGWHDNMVDLDLDLANRNIAELDDDELEIALSRLDEIMENDAERMRLDSRNLRERERALQRKKAQIEQELRRRNIRNDSKARRQRRTERRRRQAVGGRRIDERFAGSIEERSESEIQEQFIEAILGRPDVMAEERQRLDGITDPDDLRRLAQEYRLRADAFRRLAYRARIDADQYGSLDARSRRTNELADGYAALAREFDDLALGARNARLNVIGNTLSPEGTGIYWRQVGELRNIDPFNDVDGPDRLRSFANNLTLAAERNIAGSDNQTSRDRELATNLGRAQQMLVDDALFLAVKAERDKLPAGAEQRIFGWEDTILREPTAGNLRNAIEEMDDVIADLRRRERRAFNDEDIALENALRIEAQEMERIQAHGVSRLGRMLNDDQRESQRDATPSNVPPATPVLETGEVRAQEALRGGDFDEQAQRDYALSRQNLVSLDEQWANIRDAGNDRTRLQAAIEEAERAKANWRQIGDDAALVDGGAAEFAAAMEREWDRILQAATRRARGDNLPNAVGAPDSIENIMSSIDDPEVQEKAQQIAELSDYMLGIARGVLTHGGRYAGYSPLTANRSFDIGARSIRSDAEALRMRAYGEMDDLKRENLLRLAAAFDFKADDVEAVAYDVRKQFPAFVDAPSQSDREYADELRQMLNLSGTQQVLDNAYLAASQAAGILRRANVQGISSEDRKGLLGRYFAVQDVLQETIRNRSQRSDALRIPAEDLHKAISAGRLHDAYLGEVYELRNLVDLMDDRVAMREEFNAVGDAVRGMSLWRNANEQLDMAVNQPDEVEVSRTVRRAMEQLLANQTARLENLKAAARLRGEVDANNLLERLDANYQIKQARYIIGNIDKRLRDIGVNDQIARSRKIREESQGIVDPLQDKAEAFSRLRNEKIASRGRRSFANYFRQRYQGQRPWQDRGINPDVDTLIRLAERGNPYGLERDADAAQQVRDVLGRWFTIDNAEGRDGFRFRTSEVEVTEYGPTVHGVTGRIEAWDEAAGTWKHVGNFARQVDLADKTLFNSSMFFNNNLSARPGVPVDRDFAQSAKGKDFANIFNNHAWTWAKAAGMEKVRVSTADDGPYVWGRVGFRSHYRSEYLDMATAFRREVERYRRGDNSIIRSDASADMIEYLANTSFDRNHDPATSPAHFDYIVALGDPVDDDHKRDTYDWFKDNAYLGSGTIDLNRSGLIIDDPESLLDDPIQSADATPDVVSATPDTGIKVGGNPTDFMSRAAYGMNYRPQPVDSRRGLVAEQPTEAGRPAIPRRIVNDSITSQSDADAWVRDGNPLAEVPNAFLREALVANASRDEIDPDSRFLQILPNNGAQGQTEIYLLRDASGRATNQGYVLKSDFSSSPVGAARFGQANGAPTRYDTYEVAGWNFMAAMGISPEGAAWDGRRGGDGPGASRFVVVPHAFNAGVEGPAGMTMSSGRGNWDGGRYDVDAIVNDPDSHPAHVAMLMAEYLMDMGDRHSGNASTFRDGEGNLRTMSLDFGWLGQGSWYGSGFVDYADSLSRSSNDPILSAFRRHYEGLMSSGRYEEANAYRNGLVAVYDDIVERAERFLEMDPTEWAEGQVRGLDVDDTVRDAAMLEMRQVFNIINAQYTKLLYDRQNFMSLFNL